MSSRRDLWYRLRPYLPNPSEVVPEAEGKLVRSVGLTLEAVGLSVSVGRQCVVCSRDGRKVEAEVVGFAGASIFLMPVKRVEGLEPGARVIPLAHSSAMRIGLQTLGRVINGLGQPLDGLGPLQGGEFLDAHPRDINPLKRHPISEPLDVGIRAINALVTVGRGQRMGLFAGSGVGKSVLMGMMTKYTTADVVVVGLVGERGREVKEFIDHILGPEGMQRAVVVASPADDAPLMRLRASQLASRVAEYYRDQGLNVLLLMDSLTRFAQAQREISLAIGEPPATKGYPPSVFAKIPELVERAGNAAEGEGSITAFYTVLTEGDDLQDPIADSARAILDGHIVLSRTLAEEGVYPAIDIEASISRAMPNIVPTEHLQLMQSFKQMLSRYNQNRDLITIGAYSAGSDPLTDQAIEKFPKLRAFIQQGLQESVHMPESMNNLRALLAPVQSKGGSPLAAAHNKTPANKNAST
ncbi:flagellar protein export ATPase FliI [Gilvimarinus chinensis]|uniref:flagellar protein export ATPase FliI n=1 Tax=Gilvimarinus chinensis TaxID=396005 RepID=UPI000378AF8B|nr:flagellar protein export ATPase FliI [Gilvimarinus chinensis]